VPERVADRYRLVTELRRQEPRRIVKPRPAQDGTVAAV